MDKELAPKNSGKEIRQRIFDKMSAALEEFKANIKEKRFEASLKKAARTLANDLEKGVKKVKDKAKKIKDKTKKGKEKAKKGKKEVKNKVEPAV